MAGRLSFAVAINLVTDNFKRGANSVKNQLNAIKYQALSFIAALGVGSIGLSNFVSQLVNVSRETNRANTALKNVSGSTGQFADNLKYLLGLADKYGLEVNSLTSNFARFTASATMAGISMEEQRKIFDSVSRSVTAFSLSASESDGVMLALSQMMSKGKISSEELRLQMGEKLPIALQAMAKAAGTSVAGLDKLMKQGKLLSADILPKFADALNEMIPNIDTDNLETSLNRLKNTFTEFTNSTGAQQAFKSIVEFGTTSLKALSGEINNIFIGVIAVIAFSITKSVMSIVAGLNSIRNGSITAANAAAKAHELAEQRKLLASQRVEAAQVALARATASERAALRAKLTQATIQLTNAELAAERTASRLRAASALSASAASTSAFGRMYANMMIGIAKITASIRKMWASFAPAAIISALVVLVGKFIEIRKEQERIRNLFSSFKKEASAIGLTQEIKMLQAQLSILNDKKSTQDQINFAQDTLLKSLGIEKSEQVDLNRLVAKRIELLKAAARADFYAQKSIETEAVNKNLAVKYGMSYNQMLMASQVQHNVDYGRNVKAKTGDSSTYLHYGKMFSAIRHQQGIGDFQMSDFINDLKTFFANQKIIGYSDSELKKSQLIAGELTTIKTVDNTEVGDNKNKKQTNLEKAEDNYTSTLKELENKLANTAIKQVEYNKAVDDLNKETYLAIAGLLSPTQAAENPTFQKAKAGVENPVSSKIYDIEIDYQNELKKLINQKGNNVLTDEAYNERVKDLIKSTLQAAGSLDDIGESGQAFVAALRLSESTLKKSFVLPKQEVRDTTFDYKKTDREKTSNEKTVAEKNLSNLTGMVSGDAGKLVEDIKNAEGSLDALKTKYKDESAELVDAINEALNNVDSLDKALRLAEVKEDVKNLQKELAQGVYSGVKNIASSAERVVSAFQNLNDVFSDADASEWEKILAVLNALTQTVDGILSVVDLITRLTEVSKSLSKAKQVEAAIDTQATAQKVANVAIGATADQTGAAVKAATATGEVAANTAVAASEAGKGAAKLPFPMNIIAIGGAIAASLALFSAIPKFANGGIVSGRTLAEVGEYPGAASNPEVIAPLSKLKQLIKPEGTESSGLSGNVRFRIDGTALVGVLNNHNNRMKKIR